MLARSIKPIIDGVDNTPSPPMYLTTRLRADRSDLAPIDKLQAYQSLRKPSSGCYSYI